MSTLPPVCSLGLRSDSSSVACWTSSLVADGGARGFLSGDVVAADDAFGSGVGLVSAGLVSAGLVSAGLVSAGLAADPYSKRNPSAKANLTWLLGSWKSPSMTIK